MRRRLPSLTLLVLLAAALPVAAEGSLARLARYDGAVDVVRKGTPLGLYPDLALESGDIVHTRDGRAVVRFTEGSELRVREHSRLAVGERADRREIDVFFGRLWAHVVRQKDRTTEFKTGGTIAGVRGTRLEYVATLGGVVDVGVADGRVRVEVKPKAGPARMLELRSGQRVRVSAEGVMGDVRGFREGDLAGGDNDRARLAPGSEVKLARTVPIAGNNPLSTVDPLAPLAPDPGGQPSPPGPGMTPTPRPTPAPTPGCTPGDVTAAFSNTPNPKICGMPAAARFIITLTNRSCEPVTVQQVVEVLDGREGGRGCYGADERPFPSLVSVVPPGETATVRDTREQFTTSCCRPFECGRICRVQNSPFIDTNLGRIDVGSLVGELDFRNCPACQ